MRRPVTTAAGEDWARFTIARIAPGTMPEGRILFLTHHTEELVWRRGFLDHPNGARALAAVWVAATDPSESAHRFGRFTGRPIHRDGEASTISLERGTLRVATPDYLERELGVVPGPPPPYLAAYEVAVVSLAKLREQLDSAGLAGFPVHDGIAVSFPSPIGGAIVFR